MYSKFGCMAKMDFGRPNVEIGQKIQWPTVISSTTCTYIRRRNVILISCPDTCRQLKQDICIKGEAEYRHGIGDISC